MRRAKEALDRPGDVGEGPGVGIRPFVAAEAIRSALAFAHRGRRRPVRAVASKYGPLALATALLAACTVRRVLLKVGHAGATLDDAYIHFQYARALAQGHPLRFQAGEPMTSGATSLLWPSALAPFWAAGARDNDLVWIAWALAYVALGALAWESGQLARGLAGKTAGVAAAVMTLAFGGFAWSAASGMEVVPFAWALARAARRASEWAESTSRTRARERELLAIAWAVALLRPEGSVMTGFVAATLGAFPRDTRSTRLVALAAAAATLAVPLLLWALTGSARSTTAVVKLLPGNPYFAGPALVDAVAQNARLLAGTLLDGEIWSAEFIPRGAAPWAWLGLASVVALGRRGRHGWRAAAVLLLAATVFAPCFYVTFLWNRLRYLWPFATGWIVGLACLTRVAADAAGAVDRRWRAVGALLGGVFAGLLGSKLDGVVDDVAQSASGIDRQQVALGRWVRQHVPAGARIGVNDTGAIAYFGEHPTFDVVGLTTRDEGRYWVAGVGSRFEHYERLRAASPAALPAYFVVYPEWMNMNAVLGPALFEATVTDSTILGGQTMRVYAADWSKLGSGEQPWTSVAGRVVDTVDVADLESEAEHAYELLGARDGEQAVYDGRAPSGQAVVDGGRTRRTVERFVARLPAGRSAVGVVRLAGPAETNVVVEVDGARIGEFAVGADRAPEPPPAPAEDTDSSEPFATSLPDRAAEGPASPAGDSATPRPATWVERAFDVPAAVAGPRARVELRAAGPVAVFHYWFVAGE